MMMMMMTVIITRALDFALSSPPRLMRPAATAARRAETIRSAVDTQTDRRRATQYLRPLSDGEVNNTNISNTSNLRAMSAITTESEAPAVARWQH